MSSQVDVINLALSHLGQKSITSISEQTPSARIANVFWVPCRDDVFREHRWPFATVTKVLAEISNVEILGWDYFYAYPSLAASVWNVFNEGTVTTKELQDFEVQFDPDLNKRFICSNLDIAYAEYTHKVTDTSIWDPKFVIAMSYRLAAGMAHDLTGDAEKGLKLMDVYNAVLNEAKRISASEKRKKPNQDSSYVAARG